MTIREPGKKLFLPQFQRYEPVIQDSTAMKLLKECARKYFYRMVLGVVVKSGNPKQYIMDFGSAYHKFRELLTKLDLERKKGITQLSDAEIFKQAFEASIQNYSPTIPPNKKQDLELYSIQRLMHCCAVAFKHWQKERSQGKFEVLATEQPFNATLPDGSVIGGRADEIVKWAGRIYDRDFKTTSQELNWWKKGINPNDQGTRYIYGLGLVHGEPLGGVIYEVMLNLKGKDPVIEPVMYQRTIQQLQQWEKEQLILNRTLEIYRTEDVWPMSDTGYQCGFCEYQELCQASNEMALAQKISTLFIVKPWKMENVEQKIQE